MLKRKTVCLVILFLIMLLLIWTKYVDFDSFWIHVNHRTLALNEMPFKIIISLIISFLLISIFEKDYDYWSLFNFSWIAILVLLVNHYFISYYDYRTLDYFCSEEIKDFETKKYTDKFGWVNNDFIIKKDTINLAQNPSVDSVYEGDFKIYKSRFQKYYYLTRK